MTFKNIHAISFVIYVLFIVMNSKNYKLPRFKSFLIALMLLICGYFAVLFAGWIESGFVKFGIINGIRVFALSPFIVLLTSQVFNTKFEIIGDCESAPLMVWFGLARAACLVNNCCHGFTYYEGSVMYELSYFLTGTGQFPIQIVEAIAAIVTGILLFAFAKSRNFETNGYLFSYMMIFYSLQRFIFEFFRDNEKIIKIAKIKSADGYIGISNLSFWAIAMFVEGIIILWFLSRNNRNTLGKRK
ncbi:MAG: prolipoprotein diacylglyceryl transferase [Erysipelotrichaceae bacterium]|nr:prolipoprotein diacylglyceryl transferase [Erysipelotrichaceae bacterium]